MKIQIFPTGFGHFPSSDGTILSSKIIGTSTNADLGRPRGRQVPVATTFGECRGDNRFLKNCDEILVGAWAPKKNEKSTLGRPRVDFSAAIGHQVATKWSPSRSLHGSRVPGAAPNTKDIDKSIKTTTMVQDLTRPWAEGPANLSF